MSAKTETEQKLEKALQKFREAVYLATIKDVMARRAAGLLVLLGSGYIAYATEAASELFGYEHGELVGQPLEIVIPERYRDAHRTHFARYSANPETRPMGTVKMDLRGIRKDGTEFDVVIGLDPVEVLDEDCVVGRIVRTKNA